MSDRIAVVGAGQMGNGIAHVFAQSGFDVVMIDVSQDALDKGRATVAKNIERQVKKGTIPAEEQVKILSRIDLNLDIEAASEAALIIEAASEDASSRIWIVSPSRQPSSRRTRARSRSPRSDGGPRDQTK